MKYIFRKKINIFLASVLDAAGTLLFWPFRQKPHPEIYPPSHILIIRLDHLGDVLQATALPRIIKENFPKCRITFLTSSLAAALFENNPFVDEVMLFDASWFTRTNVANGRRSPGFFELARLLKQKKIQTGLSLRGDLRENLLLWLAGIPARIGYGVTGGGFFLSREIYYRRGVHESEHTLDLLRALRIPCEKLKPELYFSEKESAFPEKLIAEHLSSQDKLIGIQFEAGTTAKEWPVEQMKTFVGLCAKELPHAKFVFVGSDAKKFAWLPQNIAGKEQFIDLIGKTSLRELLSVVRCFKAFVGPDSGPAHIAACLTVPTLFLYSGTNVFSEWRPLAETSFVLRHEVPCSPCGLRICNIQGHPCMSGIKSDDVIRFIKERV